MTETYHTQFDTNGTHGGVITAVVETVGTVTDQSPTEMPPLYDTVNSEALAALLCGARDQDINVTFTYEKCRISVSNRGEIVVRSLDA